MSVSQSSVQPNGVHAAIDIGTNSFHLVVARPLADGGFEVLTIEKDVVRLGQGSGEMKRLAPDAIDRGIASLTRMAGVAASYHATVHAVATSAVREATNRSEFVNRARDEAGIDVEVISGFEEARLIHLGVLQALPVYDQRLLVVDIGGGSTEFLVGLGSEVKAARSLKLGAIRLSERFFAGEADNYSLVDSAQRVDRCRQYATSALAATAHEYRGFGVEVVAGSSGTITALAKMAAARRGETPDVMNGVSFTSSELGQLVNLITATAPSERASLDGIEQRRVDIILAGATLLQAIFASFGIEALTVSGYALREGLVFDRLQRRALDSPDRLGNLRRTNIERLSQSLDPDAKHAETTARLALLLFDQTTSIHAYGPWERELLEYAALVHNVGLSISHAAHHKHSYYVVRHSEKLTGFSERERTLMALVSRYHRRSHPMETHQEWSTISTADQQRVTLMAGILRTAIGLDRGHRDLVADLKVEQDDGSITINVTPKDEADIGLELFSAQERSTLLSKSCFNWPVIVVLNSRSHADTQSESTSPSIEDN